VVARHTRRFRIVFYVDTCRRMPSAVTTVSCGRPHVVARHTRRFRIVFYVDTCRRMPSTVTRFRVVIYDVLWGADAIRPYTVMRCFQRCFVGGGCHLPLQRFRVDDPTWSPDIPAGFVSFFMLIRVGGCHPPLQRFRVDDPTWSPDIPAGFVSFFMLIRVGIFHPPLQRFHVVIYDVL